MGKLKSAEDLTYKRSLYQEACNRMQRFLENLISTVGLPLVNIKYELSHQSTKNEILLASLMLAVVFLPLTTAQVLDVLNDPNANNTALKYVYGEIRGNGIQWLGAAQLQGSCPVGCVEVQSDDNPELATSAAMIISRNETAVVSLLIQPGSDTHKLFTIQSTTERLSANITVDRIISSWENISGLKIVIDHRLLLNGLFTTVYEARTIGHRYHAWNVNGEHFITFNAGDPVLNAHRSTLCENGTLACRIAVGMSLLKDEMITVLIIIDEEDNVYHDVSVNTDEEVFRPSPTTAAIENETTSDTPPSNVSVPATAGTTEAAPQLSSSVITITIGVAAALLLQYLLV